MRNVSFVNPNLLSWRLSAKPNLNWAKCDREPSDGQYSRCFEKKYRHFLAQFKSSFGVFKIISWPNWCWRQTLVTKCVSDNSGISKTDLIDTNISKLTLNEVSWQCHHHRLDTTMKSSTYRCHQHQYCLLYFIPLSEWADHSEFLWDTFFDSIDIWNVFRTVIYCDVQWNHVLKSS